METNKERFKEWLEIKKLKERSVKEYLLYLEKLQIFSKLNQETINLFLTAHNNRVARAFLKNYLDFLWDNKESINLSNDEALKIKEIKLPKIAGRNRIRLPEAISFKEVLMIERQMTNERNKLMVLLQFFGGLRSDELVKIKPFDFDWRSWKENLQNSGNLRVIGKGDKERVVFVPPKIMFRVEQWIKNYASKRNPDPKKPLFMKADTYRRLIYEASEKALNKRIHPHMLRHSCATWLLDKGWDIRKIQVYLGHESITSTQVYAHVNKKSLKDQFSMALDL